MAVTPRHTIVLLALVLCAASAPLLGGPATAQGAAPPDAPTREAKKLLPIPPWAEVGAANAVDNHPLDKAGRRFAPGLGGLPQALRSGSGPSTGIQVHLATGTESYLPAADVIASNPSGSDAVFQRSFRSDGALQGYGSPGLSAGWVHNYDVVIRPLSGEGWTDLCIVYPSGEEDRARPTLDENGAPTGQFKVANGAPLVITGTPLAAANSWGVLVVKWRSAAWRFVPFSKDTYVLDRIDNLQFAWDNRRALVKVADLASGNPLMTLQYNTSGYLASVSSASGSMRIYEFGVSRDSTVKKPFLLRVSQLFSAGEAAPPPQWAYGYIAEGASPLLSAVTVPSPTGQGISTCTILYDKGRVAAHVDAEGNQRRYTYNPNHTTIQVVGASGRVEMAWIQNIDDLGRNVGTTDADGHSTKIEYGR